MIRYSPILVLGLVLHLGASMAWPRTLTNQALEGALTCQCSCGLTVHSCNHLQCGFAIPAKEQIAEQIKAGSTREQILKSFVTKYGEKVLSSPTTTGFNLVAWTMPFVVVFMGVLGIVAVIRRWKPDSDATINPAISREKDVDPYGDTVRKELETYDG